jgi:dihydropteroate synthase
VRAHGCRSIEALAKRFAAPLSIDTRKAPVAEAALAAGARS